MSDIKTWIVQELPTLAAAMGLGGGSGVFAKKFIDRDQNKRIKELEGDVTDIKTKLEVNTRLDMERQVSLNMTLDKIDKRFDRMDDKLDRILENQNKRTR